jgi:O-antigen/teichoic acid export membrane protein
MKSESFLRHAVVYGLASLLTQAAGLVLLPLYTRFLTPADYGVLEILGRIAETAATVLLLGGFRQALLTFYQQAPDETERRRVVNAAFFLAGAGFILGVGLSFGIVYPLRLLLPLDDVLHCKSLLTLALLAITLEPFTLLPLALIQSRMQSGRFVCITLAQFLTLVGLRVVLIVWCHLGVAGVLIGTVLTTGVWGVLLTPAELWRGAMWPRWETVRRLVVFALPMLPGGLCFFVMQHGDRFFLRRFTDSHTVGIYSLGYKLALAVGTFSLSPLYMVWSARMYEVARQPNAPIVFGRVFTRVLGAFIFVGLGLSIFQDEVVRFIAGPAYADASAVIAPVVLAGFCQAAGALMDAAFYIRRRTPLKLRLTLEATAVMVALYIALIPMYAGLGAALATLGGFAFLAVRTWRVTQTIFPVRYEWRRIAGGLGLALALWGLSRLLPADATGFACRAVLLFSWPLLIWQLGLLTIEEKEYALVTLGRLPSLWRSPRLPLRLPSALSHSAGVAATAGRPRCSEPTPFSR